MVADAGLIVTELKELGSHFTLTGFDCMSEPDGTVFIYTLTGVEVTDATLF
jgi:hypothetical protein